MIQKKQLNEFSYIPVLVLYAVLQITTNLGAQNTIYYPPVSMGQESGRMLPGLCVQGEIRIPAGCVLICSSIILFPAHAGCWQSSLPYSSQAEALTS